MDFCHCSPIYFFRSRTHNNTENRPYQSISSHLRSSISHLESFYALTLVFILLSLGTVTGLTYSSGVRKATQEVWSVILLEKGGKVIEIPNLGPYKVICSHYGQSTRSEKGTHLVALQTVPPISSLFLFFSVDEVTIATVSNQISNQGVLSMSS